MNCSCIKGNYDFTIESLDCSRLVYNDLSDWMIEDYYMLPSTYDLEILVPGRKEFITKTVSANGATVITTEDLNLKSKCIVDGIYCFQVNNCGTLYKRTKAVTYNLQCCIDNLLITATSSKEVDTVKYLQMVLDGVHLNAKHNHINEAVKQFQFASISLESLNCSC